MELMGQVVKVNSNLQNFYVSYSEVNLNLPTRQTYGSTDLGSIFISDSLLPAGFRGISLVAVESRHVADRALRYAASFQLAGGKKIIIKPGMTLA